jgi:hypothetical protein
MPPLGHFSLIRFAKLTMDVAGRDHAADRVARAG